MKRLFARQPLMYGVIALGFVGLLSLALILASLNPNPSSRAVRLLPLTPISATSPIAVENQQAGTAHWELDPHANPSLIQGYAGAVSVLAGQNLPLYISTQVPEKYNLDVYRIGWYQGLGGRLMFSAHNQMGLAQGFSISTGFHNCLTCTIDSKTLLVQAHWKSNFVLPVGENWLSGVYLIKLATQNLGESYIIFVVRNDTSTSALLADLPINTYEAYNSWGGYSLYRGEDSEGSALYTGLKKAVEVSFDRPFDRSAGAGDFLAWDIHEIRWMERLGYDVSYTTDVNIAETPASLLRHRVFVALGHNEYWTLEMRNGLETALAQGMSMAFLGADDIYWQSRYLPNALAAPDRIVVCYKVSGYANATALQSAQLDPVYRTSRKTITAEWRDPLLNRPEAGVMGIQYHSITIKGKPQDWVASDQPNSLLQDAGIKPGQHITGGLLGYEYDGIGPSAQTPSNLVILGKSVVKNQQKHTDIALTAYYIAPSGAMVFDAGSIWWSYALDEFTPPYAYQVNILKGSTAIAKLTQLLIDQMLVATPTAPAQLTPKPTATPGQTNSTNTGMTLGQGLHDWKADELPLSVHLPRTKHLQMIKLVVHFQGTDSALGIKSVTNSPLQIIDLTGEQTLFIVLGGKPLHKLLPHAIQ